MSPARWPTRHRCLVNGLPIPVHSYADSTSQAAVVWLKGPTPRRSAGDHPNTRSTHGLPSLANGGASYSAA
jgi:hypothetical protein